MGFPCGLCCGGSCSPKSAIAVGVGGTIALAALVGALLLTGKELDAPRLAPFAIALVALWAVSAARLLDAWRQKRAAARAAQNAQSEAVKPGRSISGDDAR